MMKKKRKISISDPHLRQVAQNFRNVWREAIWEQIKDLEASKEYIQAENLKRVYHNSILRCATCSTLKGDRFYNHSSGAWFCPRCWKINKDFYISMMEKKKKGENLGDFREELMEGFKD